MKENVKRKFKKRTNKVSKTREFDKDRSTGDFDAKPRTNDISWYTINDQLLRDAGSLSFGNPLGNSTRITELSEFGTDITYPALERWDKAVPGIMALHYVPTIGPSENNYSPVNIAARALFSVVRKAQSGRWNYEPADLMKYILALDSCYMMYAYLARVYGVARVYSAVNRYWPDAVFASLRIDRNDVIANLADLRYYINSLAVRLNTLCAPNGIKLFDRHFFMNMGVWKDAPFDKSQMYIFVPDLLYVYDEMNTTDVPAVLKPIYFHTSNSSELYTVKDLIGIAESMVNPLMASEDIGVISGDLYKAFGVDGSKKLAMVDESFEVYPVYDANVLRQIHNSRFNGKLKYGDTSLYNIVELTTQDGNAGALVQQLTTPFIDNNANGVPINNIAHMLDIDLELNEITPEVVMEATRLTNLGTVYTSEGETVVYPTVYGSELMTYGSVYTMENGSMTFLLDFLNASRSYTEAASNSVILSSFEMHPLFTVANANISNKAVTQIGVAAQGPFNYDINSYTVIGKTALRKLHESALLALFNIPAAGEWNNN